MPQTLFALQKWCTFAVQTALAQVREHLKHVTLNVWCAGVRAHAPDEGWLTHADVPSGSRLQVQFDTYLPYYFSDSDPRARKFDLTLYQFGIGD